jgi:hypothetical protein
MKQPIQTSWSDFVNCAFEFVNSKNPFLPFSKKGFYCENNNRH